MIKPLEDALRIQKEKIETALPDGSKEPNDSEDPEDKTYQSFDDFRKRRFLWYYDSYMHTIDVESAKVRVNQQFAHMEFEALGNEMKGIFKYPELKARLEVIKNEITNETQRWAVEGLREKQRESLVACTFLLKHQQIVADFGERNEYSVDLALVDDNPFVWLLTYFGRPTTNLCGGVFKIKIHLSARFPEEQPRVFVQTPIFHHRVSKDGVLCYVTDRPGELAHHIDAIVRTLEEESPAFDPRTTVNLEASKLFWGTPEDRKKYNRALQRSVEQSTEFDD